MKRPIGYYVHHHGVGHRDRAVAVSAEADGRIVLIGTGLEGHTGNVARLELPDDRMPATACFDGLDGSAERPLSLHYAPLRHREIPARMALIANWIAAEQPALMVVDVSVEIAMLARLCATPVAYVRLSGTRDDPAHFDAFRGARVLIAPFHADLDDPNTPSWIRGKTVYCPGMVTMPRSAHSPETGRVVVVSGKGGWFCDAGKIAEAARSTPSRRWRAIGPALELSDVPENLELTGWSNDPLSEIARAEIVVGAAGDGLVNAVIAMARPFVCIPEQRPYGEQIMKAQLLKANNAAVALDGWPDGPKWPAILDEARALDTRNLIRLGDPNGARNACKTLEALAEA